MMKNDYKPSDPYMTSKSQNVVYSSTTSRLPIVLCLDVSPSMGGYNRIENLNAAINLLYKQLNENDKTRVAAEIAIVTFSTDIEMNTDFEALDCLKDIKFAPVFKGGTNLSKAVILSVKKIEERIAYLSETNDPYLPFLVLVTDGNPDHNDDPDRLEEAIQSVVKHCEKGARPYIAPYIIGVGNDVTKDALDRFAKKFTGEAIIIDGDADSQRELFKELFSFIGKSIKDSIRGNDDLRDLFKKLQKDSQKKVTYINKRKGKFL